MRVRKKQFPVKSNGDVSKLDVFRMKKIARPFLKNLREAIVVPPEKFLVFGGEALLAHGKPYLFLEAHWYEKWQRCKSSRILLDIVVSDGKMQKSISIDCFSYVEEATTEELINIGKRQLFEGTDRLA